MAFLREQPADWVIYSFRFIGSIRRASNVSQGNVKASFTNSYINTDQTAGVKPDVGHQDL